MRYFTCREHSGSLVRYKTKQIKCSWYQRHCDVQVPLDTASDALFSPESWNSVGRLAVKWCNVELWPVHPILSLSHPMCI
jgi:hypothetical protein